MTCSIKLPQRPAFARSTASQLLVSTYQLEGSDSRVGSLYILTHSLDIVRCITAPAGVFRFDFVEPHVIIAAVTDGSLFTASITEDILLDVSSPSPSNHVSCTDKMGFAYVVDLGTGIVIASWKAHSLPYTDTGCEVWTCAQKDTTVCTGGEDATLKVWDARSHSVVQRFSEFEAGVTFSDWQKYLILTGSYDQQYVCSTCVIDGKRSKLRRADGGVWKSKTVSAGTTSSHARSCNVRCWALYIDEES
ncbi:hypothetical protein COOONC_18120 [Cooperia oncophora]